MYQEFYNLSRLPFDTAPNPEFFFPSRHHREALATLVYGVRFAKGFMLVSGDVGTGKTLLVQALKRELGDEDIVLEVSTSWVSPEEVLQELPRKTGLQTDPAWNRLELQEKLREHLEALNARGCRVVLVLDEAQQLPESTLEGIRMLSNLESSQEKLIQVIFLGQQELETTLSQHSMRQVQQRIALRRTLTHFDRGETEAYVRHRLAVAGGAQDLFAPASIDLIHRYSRGVPRLINLICDNALITGFARGAGVIDRDVLREAIADVPQLKPEPLEVREAQREDTEEEPTETNPAARSQRPAIASEVEPPQRAKSGLTNLVWVAGVVLIIGVFIWAVDSLQQAPPVVTSESIAARPATPSPPPVVGSSALPSAIREVEQASREIIVQPGASEVEPLPQAPLDPVVQDTDNAIETKPLSPAASVVRLWEESLVPSVPEKAAPLEPDLVVQDVATDSDREVFLSALSMPVPIAGNELPTGNAASTTIDGDPAFPFSDGWKGAASAEEMPESASISVLANRHYEAWNPTVADILLSANPGIKDLHRIRSGTPIRFPDPQRGDLVVAAGNDNWLIYYGTEDSQHNARYRVAALAKVGETPEIVEGQQRNQTMYRIYLAGYSSREEALAASRGVWFQLMPFVK